MRFIFILCLIILVPFSFALESIAQNLQYNDLCTEYSAMGYTAQSFTTTSAGNLTNLYVYIGSIEGFLKIT